MITYEGLYKQLSKQGHNKYWLRKTESVRPFWTNLAKAVDLIIAQ